MTTHIMLVYFWDAIIEDARKNTKEVFGALFIKLLKQVNEAIELMIVLIPAGELPDNNYDTSDLDAAFKQFCRLWATRIVSRNYLSDDENTSNEMENQKCFQLLFQKLEIMKSLTDIMNLSED